MKAIKKLLFVGLAMASISAYADKKLYIEDFEIAPGEQKELEVRILCDEAWGGFQFRIKAPEGISFIPVSGKSNMAIPITDDFDPDWMAFTKKVLTKDNADTPDMDDTGCLSVVAGGVQGDECPIDEDVPVVRFKIEASDTFDPSGSSAAPGKFNAPASPTSMHMFNLKISDDTGAKTFKLDDYYVATDVIETIAGEKAVKDVKYVNMLGVESTEPFEGVNVVVTTYEDGTKASQKVVK